MNLKLRTTPRIKAMISAAAAERSALCLLGALSVALSATLSGCGSNVVPIKVGPITFTDSNGKHVSKPESLTAGASNSMEATVAKDVQLLGVNWTVACGSKPPTGTPLPPGTPVDDSCGTFTPVHTASGPVPSYATSGAGVVTLYTAPAAPPKEGVVTLYAASTSDPTRYSYLTLPIVGGAIAIEFGSVPPTSLTVATSAVFKAVLTNDYAAAGATWSVTCGTSDCGSFSPQITSSGVATTYLAPSAVPPSGSVVITATSVTDSTKSISATVAIAP